VGPNEKGKTQTASENDASSAASTIHTTLNARHPVIHPYGVRSSSGHTCTVAAVAQFKDDVGPNEKGKAQTASEYDASSAALMEESVR
jgi:hypothetical protein